MPVSNNLSRLIRPFLTSTRPGITTTTAAAAMSSSTSTELPPGAQRATVAAGCFWGVEHMYRKFFGNDKGLIDAKVGYIGGKTENPAYEAVCTGRTGHAEATQIIYDPDKVSYRQLIEFFYRMHDPTTANAQGPDKGTQYRSAIFVHDDEQERVAREVTEAVNQKWWNGKVVTQIASAKEWQWWDAETYHQLYLDKTPGGYACPSHLLRSFPPLDTVD